MVKCFANGQILLLRKEGERNMPIVGDPGSFRCRQLLRFQRRLTGIRFWRGTDEYMMQAANKRLAALDRATKGTRVRGGIQIPDMEGMEKIMEKIRGKGGSSWYAKLWNFLKGRTGVLMEAAAKTAADDGMQEMNVNDCCAPDASAANLDAPSGPTSQPYILEYDSPGAYDAFNFEK